MSWRTASYFSSKPTDATIPPDIKIQSHKSAASGS
jgi:hypothetical protein